jgi:hypothetical protein
MVPEQKHKSNGGKTKSHPRLQVNNLLKNTNFNRFRLFLSTQLSKWRQNGILDQNHNKTLFFKGILGVIYLTFIVIYGNIKTGG